jgi:glycosyltransferase involved in cell wall biosynthesis
VRILHAIHDFLPVHRAGSELYAYRLAQELKRRGHDAQVLCAEFDPSRRQGTVHRRVFEGLPVHEVVNNWRFGTFAETWRSPRLDEVLARVLDEVQPDVLHVHSLLNLSFSLPGLAQARGVPALATLHDYSLVCASGGQRLFLEERHVCHRIEPERCARCFTHSPFFLRMTAERLPIGPSRGAVMAVARQAAQRFPRAMAVVQAATGALAGPALAPSELATRLEHVGDVFRDMELFVAPAAALGEEYVALGLPREKLKISDYGFAPLQPAPRVPRAGPLRIGFVGTIAFHKGAHVILEACRRLPAGAFELSLFGSLAVAPPYVAELKRAAEGLPVHFRGGFEETRAGEVYAQLDVLVVSSLWPENSPLVIHEAFQAGVPVVGANVGGVPGLVRDGENGLVYEAWSPVSLASALGRLLSEPGLLGRLAEASGRTPVKSVEEDAREWEERYARAKGARR